MHPVTDPVTGVVIGKTNFSRGRLKSTTKDLGRKKYENRPSKRLILYYNISISKNCKVYIFKVMPLLTDT